MKMVEKELAIIAGAILMSAIINARDMQHSKTLGSGELYIHLHNNFYFYAESRESFNSLPSEYRNKVHELYKDMITCFHRS